jgi:hypothetical protein
VPVPVLDALALAVAAREPVLIWGGPGVGKTSAVTALAASAGLPCELVIASIREPTDFAGLPVVADDGTVRFAPPRWAQRLAVAGRGVLFLDEISTAPPAVQAALLRVVLERTVGDLPLPPGVAVVAAANPPDEAADGWDLAAPLANRFCHLTWEVDPVAWVDGVLGGFETAALPALDPVVVAPHERTARALVTTFVARRPHLLHARPSDEGDAGRAWPSPRSWTMATRLLGAATAAGARDEVIALLVAGAVGPAAAAELLAWRVEGELPDPEEILRDPSSFRLPDRADRAHAALSALAAAVVADPTPERWQAAWRAVAVGARGSQPDVAVAAVRTLVAHRPAGARPPSDVLRTMTPLLRSAGMFERLTGPPA